MRFGEVRSAKAYLFPEELDPIWHLSEHLVLCYATGLGNAIEIDFWAWV